MVNDTYQDHIAWQQTFAQTTNFMKLSVEAVSIPHFVHGQQSDMFMVMPRNEFPNTFAFTGNLFIMHVFTKMSLTTTNLQAHSIPHSCLGTIVKSFPLFPMVAHMSVGHHGYLNSVHFRHPRYRAPLHLRIASAGPRNGTNICTVIQGHLDETVQQCLR